MAAAQYPRIAYVEPQRRREDETHPRPHQPNPHSNGDSSTTTRPLPSHVLQQKSGDARQQIHHHSNQAQTYNKQPPPPQQPPSHHAQAPSRHHHPNTNNDNRTQSNGHPNSHAAPPNTSINHPSVGPAKPPAAGPPPTQGPPPPPARRQRSPEEDKQAWSYIKTRLDLPEVTPTFSLAAAPGHVVNVDMATITKLNASLDGSRDSAYSSPGNDSQYEFDMEDTSSKFLYPAEDFEKTPTIQDGVSKKQELCFRQKLAMLMQNIGIKSNLSQLAVNTSVIYMHRFFMYRSVKKVARVHLAIAFVFAAGKVEESARKLEILIRTALDIIKVNKNRDFLDKTDELTYRMDCDWRHKVDELCRGYNVESPAYLEMRKIILDYEIEIYSVIGFHLQVTHPHNYVIRMCAMLGAENIKDISQYAYNLATASSQLTMMCLRYKPDMIATVCLNIASIAHQVSFVSMKDPSINWFQVHDPTTDNSTVQAVTQEFMDVIGDCAMLPTWMGHLSRQSRHGQRPGPARPGAASQPQSHRPPDAQSLPESIGGGRPSNPSPTPRPRLPTVSPHPPHPPTDTRGQPTDQQPPTRQGQPGPPHHQRPGAPPSSRPQHRPSASRPQPGHPSSQRPHDSRGPPDPSRGGAPHSSERSRLPALAADGRSPHTPRGSPPPTPPQAPPALSPPHTLPHTSDASPPKPKPKISLESYKNRVKPAPLSNPSPVAQPAPQPHHGGATNSPGAKQQQREAPQETSHPFSEPPTDSPNPPHKLKLKLEPSGASELHAVNKMTPSGLKIKIKTPKMGGTPESGASRESSTPHEDGEITEGTPPTQGLKIRIGVPRASDGGESTSDAGAHHHHHHRGHHKKHHHRDKDPHRGEHRDHHRHDKKHKKHRSERSSSKRSSSSAAEGEDRPAKHQRSDTSLTGYPGGASATVSRAAGQTKRPSNTAGGPPTASRSLQDNGFSINEAFTSTMPSNIFDSDDEDGSSFPPITSDNVNPPHHERFHQLMAQHRAKQAQRPPLPGGLPPPPPPPSSSQAPPPPPHAQ